MVEQEPIFLCLNSHNEDTDRSIEFDIYHEGIEMLTVSGVRSPPLTPDMLTKLARQHKWVTHVDPDMVNISMPS